jgi:hypothetical protein
MSLYKYREIDENTLSALDKSQVWFSTGKKFNDPFDCSLNLPMCWASHDSIVNHIMNKTNLPSKYKASGLNDEQINKMVIDSAKKFIDNTDIFENKNSEEFSEILFGSLTKALVFCLSQSYTNTLMWSHYASDHKGLCIKFNKSKLLASLNLYHSGIVDYSGKPYDVFSDLGLDELHPAKNICFMKSPDWTYEKEYRLMHSDLAKKDNESLGFTYSLDSVEAIYFGLNSTQKQRSEVMSRLKSKGYKYYKMETDPKHLSYELQIGSELSNHS